MFSERVPQLYRILYQRSRLWNLTSPRSVRGWSGGAKRRRQPLFTERSFSSKLCQHWRRLYIVSPILPWKLYPGPDIYFFHQWHMYIWNMVFLHEVIAWLGSYEQWWFIRFFQIRSFSGHFLISWFLEMVWKGAATFGRKTHRSFFSCLRSRLAETQTYLRQTPTGGFGLRCKGFRYQIWFAM